jgi:hypothetical protein
MHCSLHIIIIDYLRREIAAEALCGDLNVIVLFAKLGSLFPCDLYRSLSFPLRHFDILLALILHCIALGTDPGEMDSVKLALGRTDSAAYALVLIYYASAAA